MGRGRWYTLGCIALAAGLACNAFAQTTPPDIGTTLREMQQQRPTPPPPPKPVLDVDQSDGTRAESGAETKFAVARIRVTGSTAYPAKRLEALVSRYAGSEASLADLRRGAATITKFYRAHGYPLARAFIPSQEVRDGVVEIAVLEGRYGKLKIENVAGVSGKPVTRILRNAASPNPIRSAPLERDLLLLQELPGVIPRATLTPGADVGTADLIVHLTRGRHFQGSVDADNFGNRYTGQWRTGLGVTGANLAGLGDQLVARGVVTNQHGVLYGRVGYQIPIDEVRVGAAVTRTHYSLGQQFAALDASGDATVSTLYGLYPCIRSLGGALDLQLALSRTALKDTVGATATADRRSNTQVTLSVNGNVRDDLLSGGVTSGSLAYEQGHLDIQDSTAADIDQATAQTAGSYHRITYTGLRLQNLGDAFTLYLAVSGQLAGKNLDPSVKFNLGGPDAVRAYPQGEGVGDSGLLGTLELRYLVKSLRPYALPELVAFFDGGRVNINQNPFLTGSNSNRLLGAGVGLNVLLRHGLRVRANWAWKVGAHSTSSAPESSSRGWLQLGKDF